MKILVVKWYPRLQVAIDEENFDYSLKDIPDSCLDRSSFYCIYGQHPVYGPDVLLYIGETKKAINNSRDIAKRIREHLSGRFWSHTDLSITIGIPEQALKPDVVQAVESILIAAHMPALNRRHIDGALPSAKSYLVQNTGFARSLVPECSGDYWC